MLMTETETRPQCVTPFRRIDILIELVIQITFHALLFQSANGTARFAASLQDVENRRTWQKTIIPFPGKFRSQPHAVRSKCTRFSSFADPGFASWGPRRDEPFYGAHFLYFMNTVLVNFETT